MRLEGWEKRLMDVIESARKTPYVLGKHDCFRVACAAIEALTGVDRWPEWSGRYSTREEAIAFIREYGGGDFDDAASRFFGTEPADAKFARRGDIMKYQGVPDAHLGVCLGERTAMLGPDGLAFIRTRACEKAWRIG